MWWHHFLFIYFIFLLLFLHSHVEFSLFPVKLIKISCSCPIKLVKTIKVHFKVPLSRQPNYFQRVSSFSSAFILGQKRFSYSELVILKSSFWLLELFSALAWKPNLPSLRSRLQPQRVAFCDSFHSAASATAATRRIDQSQHHQRAHDHHRQPSPLRRAAVPSDFQLRQHEEEIAERFSGKHDGFYQVSTTRLYN